MDYGRDAAALGQNAEWYGTAQYLLFDLKENLTLSLRGVWFRHDDDFRVLSRSRIANHPAAGGLSCTAAIKKNQFPNH